MTANAPSARFALFIILFCFIACFDAHAQDDVETAGDILVYVLPAIAGGLTIASQDGTGAMQFLESATLSLGTTFTLKYAVSEERPNHKDHYSFPSGHSSASFASAEFIRKRYGWYSGIPAYAVASFVAYSRVEARQHHTHDVVAGAAIGIGSSYLFTEPYAGWRVQIESYSTYQGIRLSRSW